MLSGFAAVFIAADGIQTHKGGRPDLIHQIVVIVHGQAQGCRDFYIGRRLPLGLLDLLDDGLNLPRLVMNGSRHPIEAAQFVKDGSTNADSCVGLEAGSGQGIVVADRIQKTHQSGAVKVVQIDMGWQTQRQSTHDILHEWKVLFDELRFLGCPRPDLLVLGELRRGLAQGQGVFCGGRGCRHRIRLVLNWTLDRLPPGACSWLLRPC